MNILQRIKDWCDQQLELIEQRKTQKEARQIWKAVQNLPHEKQRILAYGVSRKSMQQAGLEPLWESIQKLPLERQLTITEAMFDRAMRLSLNSIEQIDKELEQDRLRNEHRRNTTVSPFQDN